MPHQLKAALTAQAGLARQVKKLEFTPGELAVAFAANQRDEVRDLHDVAGALSAQPGMKQQTFVAGFSAGAGASAGKMCIRDSLNTVTTGQDGTVTLRVAPGTFRVTELSVPAQIGRAHV